MIHWSMEKKESAKYDRRAVVKSPQLSGTNF